MKEIYQRILLICGVLFLSFVVGVILKYFGLLDIGGDGAHGLKYQEKKEQAKYNNNMKNLTQDVLRDK